LEERNIVPRNGRALVLSDHSVFINGMMLQPKSVNDNFDFAYNCINWLTERGARKQVLLFEDGAVNADFSLPPLKWVPDASVPPLDPRVSPVAVMNKLLAHWEDRNLFNSVLLNHVQLGRILSFLAIVLTLALVAYGYYRLLQGRHRLELGTPLFARTLHRLTPALATVDQRLEAMLREGNLWAAARNLARHCFGPSHRVEPGLTGQEAELAGTLLRPRIRVKGGWWKRWVLGHQVRRLWQLAYAETPEPVSPREFSRLVAWSHKIRAALADGTLHLDEPSSD
jgi:hypothetical protein